MKNIHEWANTFLIGAVILLVLVGGQSAEPTNIGAGTRMPNGISADTTSPIVGEVRGTTLTSTGLATLSTLSATGDATFGGGVSGVVVTTTNAATSSLSVGCIQVAGTSTATQIKLALSTAALSTSTLSGATGLGVVTWTYGTCP